MRRLLGLGILLSGLIGCATPTSLKPTAELLKDADQAFTQASDNESVRYAPDDFLTAKSAIGTAKSAWQESQSATNLELKDTKEKAARRAAYEAWFHAETALAKAKEEKAKEQIKLLRQEIAQNQADQQRFEAEARAAREKRAKELAEIAKSNALQKAQAETTAKEQALKEAQEAQKRAALEQAAKEAAERQALLEQQAKEQALKAKQELETKLVSAMQEIAKVREEKRGLIVSLSDILFEFGKSTLAKGTQENLAKLGKILLAYPDRQIVVEGHTDNIGSDEFNRQLSSARAQAVQDALIRAGVNPQMIKAVGFGKAQPIASNATPEGRQQNRRVEVVVLNPKTPSEAAPAPATP